MDRNSAKPELDQAQELAVKLLRRLYKLWRFEELGERQIDEDYLAKLREVVSRDDAVERQVRLRQDVEKLRDRLCKEEIRKLAEESLPGWSGDDLSELETLVKDELRWHREPDSLALAPRILHRTIATPSGRAFKRYRLVKRYAISILAVIWRVVVLIGAWTSYQALTSRFEAIVISLLFLLGTYAVNKYQYLRIHNLETYWLNFARHLQLLELLGHPPAALDREVRWMRPQSTMVFFLDDVLGGSPGSPGSLQEQFDGASFGLESLRQRLLCSSLADVAVQCLCLFHVAKALL